MKPYFRIKGKYGDKRNRVIIEWQEDRWTIRSKSLPKPEILLKILDGIIWTKTTRGKDAKITLAIRDTLLQKKKNKK